MTETGNALQPSAKFLARITRAVCALAFLPSLLPAGFAIYVFDTPGSGTLHNLYVWGTFTTLLLMPIVTIAGAFVPRGAYKRGWYTLAVIWSVCTLAWLLYWAPFAWEIYFT